MLSIFEHNALRFHCYYYLFCMVNKVNLSYQSVRGGGVFRHQKHPPLTLIAPLYVWFLNTRVPYQCEIYSRLLIIRDDIMCS